MRIQTNVDSLNAYRNLNNTNRAQSRSMERLSSGFRINRAADDAAGLAISEKMRGQVRGLDQAVRNAQDGISLIQTAEGALAETHEILQRMRELTVQAANDTNTAEDIGEIQAEIDNLQTELTRIGDNTEFNTKSLLDGTFTDFSGDTQLNGSGTDSLTFQIGANSNQNVDLHIEDMRAEALGFKSSGAASGAYKTALSEGKLTSGALEVTSGLTNISDINFNSGAIAAEASSGHTFQDYTDATLVLIDQAIEDVSSERSKLGALQNRLEHTIANLEVSSENLSAAESRIRDVDMAQEMMEFSKQQILEQAGTSMLAQANQAPQSVLQLLG